MPDASTRRTRRDPTPEETLLRDALGEIPAALISREPLGEGSVAGFRIEGDAVQTYFVDTSRLAVPAETGLAVGEDITRPDARIWLHPADPHLPALAPTAFAHAADVLLRRLGLELTGPTEFVAYRPGRRGVLRAPTGDAPAWIKVVRPSRVQRIVRAHRACADAGLPVPHVHGWSDEGLLVLADAHGEPAADAAWQPASLAAAAAELTDAVARVPWDEPARSIVRRLDWYSAHADDEGRALADRIRGSLARAAGDSRRVVHGDLHFGQLFLDDGRISGLIDVDTLGMGSAAEDPAAFVAHAVASARMCAAGERVRVLSLVEAALEQWSRIAGVRAYAAIHLLGYAIAADDLRDRMAARVLLRAGGSLLDTTRAEETKNALTELFESA